MLASAVSSLFTTTIARLLVQKDLIYLTMFLGIPLTTSLLANTSHGTLLYTPFTSKLISESTLLLLYASLILSTSRTSACSQDRLRRVLNQFLSKRLQPLAYYKIRRATTTLKIFSSVDRSEIGLYALVNMQLSLLGLRSRSILAIFYCLSSSPRRSEAQNIAVIYPRSTSHVSFYTTFSRLSTPSTFYALTRLTTTPTSCSSRSRFSSCCARISSLPSVFYSSSVGGKNVLSKTLAFSLLLSVSLPPLSTRLGMFLNVNSFRSKKHAAFYMLLGFSRNALQCFLFLSLIAL